MPISTLEMVSWCALSIAVLILLTFVMLLMATPRARYAEDAYFAAEAEENDRQPGDGF